MSVGESPYRRATYRYTPLIAFLLQPNVYYPAFGKHRLSLSFPTISILGKILFCSLDLIVGYLCYRLLQVRYSSAIDCKSSLISVAIFWLFNPLTAVISARGNADVLVCAAVVATLYLIETKQVLFELYVLIFNSTIFPAVSRRTRARSIRRSTQTLSDHLFTVDICAFSRIAQMCEYDFEVSNVETIDIQLARNRIRFGKRICVHRFMMKNILSTIFLSFKHLIPHNFRLVYRHSVSQRYYGIRCMATNFSPNHFSIIYRAPIFDTIFRHISIYYI